VKEQGSYTVCSRAAMVRPLEHIYCCGRQADKILVIVDNYPEGYPQLAAFMNSDESFAIFRKFGQTNCRVMIHLQSEIAALEKELEELDRSDARDGSSTSYRLVSTEHRAGWDTRQKDILQQLEEKLPVYCMTKSNFGCMEQC
jgi:hypothetical protein